MSSITVDELPIPVAIGAEGWPDFAEMVAVRNAIELQTTGVASSFTAEDLLPTWQDPSEPKRLFVARESGGIIGRATYEFGAEPGDPVVWIAVEVVHASRGRGAGAALYAKLLQLAEHERRTTLQGTSAASAGLPGDVLTARSGFGALPLADPGVRFATTRGFELEQVVRKSSLALDSRQSDTDLAAALLATDRDYRLARWVGATPEQWIADFALLHDRLRTDAPHGELDVDEPDWDEARVRAHDATYNADGRRMFVVAVEHVPSGRLVGYTDLWVSDDRGRPVSQQDTLVLSEHRGHGLGRLLKLANIAQLNELAPGHPSIHTFNAEENRPMLDVNEAMGFVPISYEAVWKRALRL